MSEKKFWFRGYNRRMWIPISIEGWASMLAFFAAIFLIQKFNNVGVQFSGEKDFWFPLLQLLAVTGLYFWLIRNRVDKRY